MNAKVLPTTVSLTATVLLIAELVPDWAEPCPEPMKLENSLLSFTVKKIGLQFF